MVKTLIRAPATNATGPLGHGLQLFERQLDIHEKHEAKAMPAMGGKALQDQMLKLRHWPGHFWMVGENLPLTDDAIDVSHGHAVLRLRGPGALYFLADYTSADLRAANIRNTGTVRCSLGPYAVLMWWDITRDIHIAVERNMAQSLVDHLKLLVQRRRALDHLG